LAFDKKRSGVYKTLDRRLRRTRSDPLQKETEAKLPPTGAFSLLLAHIRLFDDD
jgi:hypothetical protein